MSYKIKSFKKIHVISLTALLFIVFVFAINAYAASLIQSFSASADILPGMVVSLDPNDTSKVLPLSSNNISKLTGVVVPVGENSLVLTSTKSTSQQITVANDGRYSVLVDDQDGIIKPGDYLSISTIDGIAMKASDSEKDVIGQAAGTFNPTTNTVIGKETITNINNQKQTLNIGQILVDVKLSPNPTYQQFSSNVPKFLARFANTVADKSVSSERIYLSILVIGLSLFIAAVILFSSIHSGIGAIGRNPLAKKSILRGITKSVVTAIIIIIIGILAVYLILI